MGRPPCCDKDGIKKGPWTPEEDIILVSYIQQHGPGNWRSVPTNTGLQRCSKSCRLRWTNYLRPGIKRGNFTPHEEGMIIHLQALLGNKWAAIASYLPQRTDNDIKNYWNTHLKKKLKRYEPTSSHQDPLNIKTTPPSSSNNNKQSSPLSSSYASSTENISRLLENWMKTSSNSNTILLNNNTDNTKRETVSQESNEEDEFCETAHKGNIAPTIACDSMEEDNNNNNNNNNGNEGKTVNNGIDDNIIEEDDEENNPPLCSFLERWFMDETSASRHVTDGMLELPSFFSL